MIFKNRAKVQVDRRQSLAGIPVLYDTVTVEEGTGGRVTLVVEQDPLSTDARAPIGVGRILQVELVEIRAVRIRHDRLTSYLFDDDARAGKDDQVAIADPVAPRERRVRGRPCLFRGAVNRCREVLACRSRIGRWVAREAISSPARPARCLP